MRRSLPRSPNWYCAHVMCCSRDGDLLAYAGTNSIQLMNVSSRVIIGQLYGHKDRVVSLQFSFDSDLPLLASCSVDGTVRLWDYVRMECLFFHRAHQREHQPVDVCFSSTSDVVVSGDKSGFLCIWSYSSSSQNIRVVRPLEASITTMACSRSGSRSLLCVGYQSGDVLLVDPNSGTLLKRLAGHVDGIQCVSWRDECSSIAPQHSTMGDSPLTLATSSRDKSIRIWSVSPGGTPIIARFGEASLDGGGSGGGGPTSTITEAMSSFPSSPLMIEDVHLCAVLQLTTTVKPSGRGHHGRGRPRPIWLMCSWRPIDSDGLITSRESTRVVELLSTSLVDGEILVWRVPLLRSSRTSLDERRANNKVVRMSDSKASRLPLVHDRVVFSLCCVESGAPRADSPRAACAIAAARPCELVTTSMDRQVVFWNLETNKASCRVPTLGGAVNALDVSPASPWKAVAAVADKTLRVWNLRRGSDFHPATSLSTSSARNVSHGTMMGHSPTTRDDAYAAGPSQRPQRYDVHLIWEGLQTVVTSVRCHPSVAGTYAFGTQAGIVGVHAQGQSRLVAWVGAQRQSGLHVGLERRSACMCILCGG